MNHKDFTIVANKVPHLVTAEWLHEHLGDKDLRVLDIRGYVVTRLIAPGVEEADYRGAYEEYLGGHIPGASYVDWTRDIIDPDDPVPVQIASPEQFAEAMGVRGVSNQTHVIAVDHAGGQNATRLWWALKYYGHDRVSVLEGGYLRWNELEMRLEEGPVSPNREVFVPNCLPQWRKSEVEVQAMIGSPEVQLLDVRDKAQYSGEKRRGPRGGHIPGAKSLPRELFIKPGGGFKPLEEIAEMLKQHDVTPDKPIVAYCNGGVAATVALFNLDRLGFGQLSNYDGSWNEWTERPDLPVE
jgi:thiosulfate/3-mercaptopyruvate sulfurtransferase